MNKLIAVSFLIAFSSQAQAQAVADSVKSIREMSDHGGRVDWSFQNLIAFDRLDDSGFYNVYTVKPDGSDVACVTCNRDALGLPHKNVGNPAWSPSGRFMAVEAEKDRHPPVRKFYETSPGAGLFNDLWVLDFKADRAYMVAQVPTARKYGVLHPHFSFDGKRLSWSEQYAVPRLLKVTQQFGYFVLKVGDFLLGPQGPYLQNVRTYEPDGHAFYENHGFSPDGSKLIFSHNAPGTSPFKDNIYTLDLATGNLSQLTDGGYNEHALYSPDGSRIVWMTTMGNSNRGTDYWMMNADGSNKVRLTHFNESGYPEYTGVKTTASDSSWSPDGKQFVGYVQVGGINNSQNSSQYEERDYLITLQ